MKKNKSKKNLISMLLIGSILINSFTNNCIFVNATENQISIDSNDNVEFTVPDNLKEIFTDNFEEQKDKIVQWLINNEDTKKALNDAIETFNKPDLKLEKIDSIYLLWVSYLNGKYTWLKWYLYKDKKYLIFGAFFQSVTNKQLVINEQPKVNKQPIIDEQLIINKNEKIDVSNNKSSDKPSIKQNAVNKNIKTFIFGSAIIMGLIYTINYFK